MNTTREVREIIRMINDPENRVESNVEFLASVSFVLCDIIDRLEADVRMLQSDLGRLGVDPQFTRGH